MCTVAKSKKKKKKFFIRPVNKIIKSLSHLSSLSVTLSVTLSFLSQSLSHLISQNSLKQTSLLPSIASRHRSAHLTPLIASHRLASHLTPPIASFHLISRCRSLAHQVAGLKLIEAADLKPMELVDIVLVCDW